ncbi:hypothetical protein IPM65_03420 [Candidatus Roizmanbacteria bacterium]|nr:MAG: hypothetical protein IPM65_03420 [Candidatus Roizmanbacteria bacterium]
MSRQEVITIQYWAVQNAASAYSSSIMLGYSAVATASNQFLVGGNNANGYINDTYFGRGVVVLRRMT